MRLGLCVEENVLNTLRRKSYGTVLADPVKRMSEICDEEVRIREHDRYTLSVFTLLR